MGTIHVPTLLEGILEATAAKAQAEARITTLRATLEDVARRRFESEGAAPSWNTPQLGKVRLDPAGEWEARVEDEAAFGSYVAEHHPTEATVAIRIGAADAHDALQALEFIGVEPAAVDVEVRPAFLGPFLKSLTLDVTEERDDSAQVTRTVVAADHAGDGIPIVPGIGVTRSEAKLVVSLDRDRRTAAITEARSSADALVAAASDDAEDAPAELAQLHDRRRELEAMHGDQLVTIAKAHGLGSSGTKAALAERIARAELATGRIIRPASTPPTSNHDDGLVVMDTRPPSPLPEGTEVEEVSTVPLDQPVEEVPAAGDVAGVLEESPEQEAATLDPIDPLTRRRELLDGLSREVLRQYAKATGINPGGTKGDLLDRLVEAGTTVTDVNDHARRVRAS